jgi:ketosteroid isomerase-like protein
MLVMQQPEAYIAGAADLFNDDGSLKDPDTDRIFTRFKSDAFSRSMQTRMEAALAYINGDAAPLDALLTREDPATFFHPGGDQVCGAAAVQARYDVDVRGFDKGGTGQLEILQSGSSGELAFWTGLQHAEAHIQGNAIAMTLRVTEVFRFEDGNWRLAHRHADVPPNR